MGGPPVWLASVAVRDRRGNIIPTAIWTADPGRLAAAGAILRETLQGVGDESRERLFRMCVTLCLHRGVTDEEEAKAPAWWQRHPAVHLAGGPVEILASHGIPDLPSMHPCEHPNKVPFPGRSDLWLPIDCSTCEPCRARRDLEEACSR